MMVRAKIPENRARQIVIHDAVNNTFELDENVLRRILLQDGVRDKPVAVIPVVGALRKGKSFMLNFFLRYMKHLQVHAQCSSKCADWLEDPDAPLKGFSWRAGMRGDTSGILMWDEVFTVTTSEGKQVAVVFMDTEGVFDRGATMKECTTIFALSTLISSTLVYNISQMLQENVLQFLQFFTEYGRLAAGNTSEKPFDKLTFLVRDWSSPFDAPYGAEGGRAVLNEWLNVSEQQHEDGRQIREHIRSCFSEVDCFLMPHPGLKVATSAEFDGRSSDIGRDFIVQLNDLVPRLLAPDNLVVKKINGTEVTCEALLKYIKAYTNTFVMDKLPEPRSILQAAAEVYYSEAVATEIKQYNSDMDEICGKEEGMKVRVLSEHHLRLKSSAEMRFLGIPSIGGDDCKKRFLEKLMQGIDTQYKMYAESNKSRQAAARSKRKYKIYKGIAIASTLALGAAGGAVLASGTTRAAIAGVAEISSNGALRAGLLAVVGCARATTP
ncbi:atlastin-3-like [Ornithodoros turicata]|uniref:atlastin-3-like n=1 Tax=Ornithodoros turicata TaxID=34597 RepID=UPI003138C799